MCIFVVAVKHWGKQPIERQSVCGYTQGWGSPGRGTQDLRDVRHSLYH